ncbi:MAG: DUF488 domain-containing protein [Coriobacteriales bacterium]|nr:DUF488 domain-containing protein [Coriobacteriales bacterium]
MLQSQQINVVVDVRSVPASKYTPQFNQSVLQPYLKRHGINYLSFGIEFGARRTDCLDAENKVDFEKAVQTPAFLSGAQRLMVGLDKGYHITLMCSEARPLECHRFAMVSRFFYEHGLDVLHIVKENVGGLETISVKTHEELQNEMILEYVKKKKIPMICPPDMFGENECTPQKQIQLAYKQKNKEIAYHQQELINEEYDL